MRQYNSCEKTLHLQDQWPCGFCLTCDPFPHQTLQLPPPGSWTGPPTGTLGPLGFYSLAPLSHPQHSLLLASQPLQMHCLPEKKGNNKGEGRRSEMSCCCLSYIAAFLGYLEQSPVSLQPLLQTAKWKISGDLQLLIPVWSLHIHIITLNIADSNALLNTKQ